MLWIHKEQNLWRKIENIFWDDIRFFNMGIFKINKLLDRLVLKMPIIPPVHHGALQEEVWKCVPEQTQIVFHLLFYGWLLLINLGIKTDSCHCWAKTSKYQITTTWEGYQVLATWCRLQLLFQCYPRRCIIVSACKGKSTTQLIWVFIGPHILSIVSPDVTVNCEFILFLELHKTFFFFFLQKDNSRPNLTSHWHQCWKVYLHGGF